MTGFNHWDFADAFTAFQVALLIEGKDASFCTAEGYEDVYQQSASNVILSRMNSDFNETFFAYAFSDDIDGPRKLLPWENKLPSLMMNSMAKNCFEFGRKAEFEKWLADGVRSDFYSQKFERKDIQHWIDVNKFPSKYEFEKKSASIPDEILAKEECISSRWPWGNHHTELLGHLDAAAREFWIDYDPERAKTTAPKSESVIDWLKKNRKVSNTMAKAIATMLRPDDLPTGPRK